MVKYIDYLHRNLFLGNRALVYKIRLAQKWHTFIFQTRLSDSMGRVLVAASSGFAGRRTPLDSSTRDRDSSISNRGNAYSNLLCGLSNQHPFAGGVHTNFTPLIRILAGLGIGSPYNLHH